jgi:FkbM family methyltransferase
MRATIIDLIRRALGTKRILYLLESLELQLKRTGGNSSQEGASSAPADTLTRDPDSVAKGVGLAITSSDPMSYFKCEFNGAPVWLPTDTLRTMIHCVTAADTHIVLQVETAHINWMIERLTERRGDGFFVDVGAATGAATIPIALKFKSNIPIVAFEPATNAMRLLAATLEKNNIHSVTTVNAAVSDAIGEVTFVEYGQDPSGNCPFLPEASTIAYPGVQTANSNSISVKCITLDSYFLSDNKFDFANHNRAVVKIDVEGFEEQVLNGSTRFIQTFQPYFSIDIHNRIDGEGSTEKACRNILTQFGYKFVNMGHVLLASPK